MYRAGDDLGSQRGAVHVRCIGTQCNHQCGVVCGSGLYIGYHRCVVHGSEADANGGEVALIQALP